MNKQTLLVGSAAAAMAMVLGGAHAWAQPGPAAAPKAPLERTVVTGEMAKRILTKTQINGATARAIVDACVAFGRATNGTYAVFILSPDGNIVEAHVMDGVLPIGVETALLKAKTALYARTPSSVVAQRFNTVDGRLIRTDLGREQGLAYYFVGGALPIVVEDQLIGVIGVGGGNQDEKCAYDALTQVLGPQPPLSTGAGQPAPAK
ncbi:MAG: heme-binding protein [Vicinamibacterales bacterium]